MQRSCFSTMLTSDSVTEQADEGAVSGVQLCYAGLGNGWKTSTSRSQTASASLPLLRALPSSQVDLPKHQSVSQLPLRIVWLPWNTCLRCDLPTLLGKRISSSRNVTAISHVRAAAFSSAATRRYMPGCFSRAGKHLLKENLNQGNGMNVFKLLQINGRYPETWQQAGMLQ